MEITEYLVLFIAVLIGGSFALYLQQVKAKYLSWILSFSGAYLLGIAMLHLMPIAFQHPETNPGLWILLGFFVQLLLEQLSGGVEHGHIHPHSHAGGGYMLQLMLGLCLHAFFEGLPLGNYEAFQELHHGHVHSDNHLLLGIILHKAPAAFALTALLLASNFKRRTVILCLIVFAAMSPLGAALAAVLGEQGWLDQGVQEKIVAFVIGSFLHIATTILFESDGAEHHRLPWGKMALIAVGLGLAVLSAH
ncbi:MAG: ZIP family metal transporter [Saprospiraceae bacterium]